MEQEEVLIHGVSYNAMCQILHFIYTSELELSLSNVQETLVAACQLQVRLPSLQQGRPKPRVFCRCLQGSGMRRISRRRCQAAKETTGRAEALGWYVAQPVLGAEA